MGQFELQFLKKFMFGEYSSIQTIVETGTLFGESTFNMSKHFKNVITIELNEKLFRLARAKFIEKARITCFHGDSGEVLPFLIKHFIVGPAVFYLDAHWSGDKTVNWDSSKWKGYTVNTSYVGDTPTAENQVPLGREIEAIAKYHKHKAIIYIDDVDKFDSDGNGLKNEGFTGEDWSHLSLNGIMKILGSRINKCVREEFQMVIFLNEIPSDETKAEVETVSDEVKSSVLKS